MKNILLFSSILAAGTLAANSAIVFYDYASAANKDMEQNGWTSFGTVTQDASYVGAMDAQNTTWKTEGKVDGWRVCNGATTASNGYSYDLSSLSDPDYLSGEYSIEFTIQLDSHAYFSSGSNGSSNYFSSIKSGVYVESASLLVGDGMGVYWFKFGYNGTNITIDDASVDSDTPVILADFTFDSSQNVLISVDRDSGTGTFSYGSTSLTINRATNENFKNKLSVGVLATAHQGDIVFNSIALIPVPEPSVFGLLAGIGALALAGTRRRRKVK